MTSEQVCEADHLLQDDLDLKAKGLVWWSMGQEVQAAVSDRIVRRTMSFALGYHKY